MHVLRKQPIQKLEVFYTMDSNFEKIDTKTLIVWKQ